MAVLYSCQCLLQKFEELNNYAVQHRKYLVAVAYTLYCKVQNTSFKSYIHVIYRNPANWSYMDKLQYK